MRRVRRQRLKPLERWSPLLFVAAGLLLAIYATLNGLEAFTEMAFEQKGFEVGYILGFLGLLGLYPLIVKRRPWLARVGAFAAGLGVIAFSVSTLNTVAELAGIMSGDPPGWPIFVIMAAVAFTLGYAAFAVAVIRSDSLPKVIGLVLLVPAVIIVLMLAHMAVGLDSPDTVFVVSAGQALGHLAIGATLHTKDSSTQEMESSNQEEPQVVAND